MRTLVPMTTTSNDEQRFGVLGPTFLDLDRWGRRLAGGLLPAQGSQLARDDTDLPQLPLSQLALLGLATARDHLHAVRVLLEARELFPLAQLSLIRAALIGASQTVWLLEPDDRPRRLERGRCLAAHNYSEFNKCLTVLLTLTDPPHQGTLEAKTKVERRMADVSQIRDAEGEKSALNATAMIEGAATATFPESRHAGESVAVWRQTSGCAHGYQWPLLVAAGARSATRPDAIGMAKVVVGGTVEGLENPYMCAYHLARKGWELLDARGGTRPSGR